MSTQGHCQGRYIVIIHLLINYGFTFRSILNPPIRTTMPTPQRRHDDDELSIWIVYEDPPDFPYQYVARRHRGYIESGEYVTGNTLIDVRAKLPPGLMRIERSAGDDPMIRESWICNAALLLMFMQF